MENRNGLLLDFQLIKATGTAARDAVPRHHQVRFMPPHLSNKPIFTGLLGVHLVLSAGHRREASESRERDGDHEGEWFLPSHAPERGFEVA